APRRPRLAQICFLALAAFMMTNKVWSPQFVLAGRGSGVPKPGRRARRASRAAGRRVQGAERLRLRPWRSR
ncbi:hypothetical protein AB0C18_40590, partial [Nonomuraea muscovyensis]|uniref:hypothetical protein n=1 Tax=Nonomuraea muscovyensis TaxID=1124761 RepID=UPI0033F03926